MEPILAAIHEGLSRPHGNLPEVNPDPGILQGLLNEVMVADGSATRRDQDVGSRRPGYGPLGRLQLVRDNA